MPHDDETLLSLVTPVFNPPVWALDECAKSITTQLGVDTEWVLVDDGSNSQDHFKFLERLNSLPFVTVVHNAENGGISSATNLGISHARGKFIGFVDQDDLLDTYAVERVIDVIRSEPDVDLIYSDEDKVSDEGRFYDVFKKPNWSPERLRHQNYLSHLTVIRQALIDEVGGLRSKFDGSQDFDLVLRCSERARKIVHIPEVLYHWRAIESSTAQNPDSKPQAHNAAVTAVQEHLDRSGIAAEARLMPNMYVSVERTREWSPDVSVIIPSCGSEGRIAGATVCLVENCVASVLRQSTYTSLEIIIVLDEYSPPGLAERLTNLDPARVRTILHEGEFNFAAKINAGVLAACGEVLVPLNDDVQVSSKDWIEQLLTHLVEPDVGLVAPMLLLEDGRVQSAGHFFADGAHHVGAGLASTHPGPFGVLTFPSERSGATFAAVACRRSIYELVGGLHEGFPRAFNDVDFGNKLRLFGYRIIVDPTVRLYHFESLTRDPKVEESEVKLLYKRWGSTISSRDEYLPDFWRQAYGIQ